MTTKLTEFERPLVPVAHESQEYFGDVYRLNIEDREAVNQARKARASKMLRSPCDCDHTEYCGKCYPLEFRPTGIWGKT